MNKAQAKKRFGFFSINIIVWIFTNNILFDFFRSQHYGERKRLVYFFWNRLHGFEKTISITSPAHTQIEPLEAIVSKTHICDRFLTTDNSICLAGNKKLVHDRCNSSPQNNRWKIVCSTSRHLAENISHRLNLLFLTKEWNFQTKKKQLAEFEKKKCE